MTFEEIYHAHKNLVFNLALQYLQNVEDAEEVTQDVFVSVHEKIVTFRSDSSIKTWIYRITINKSLDVIKSRKSKKRFAFISSLFKNDGEGALREIPMFHHPGIEMVHKEEIKAVLEGINQLSDNQKTVLILLKIEQKSQQEVAEIMDISAKAVESLFQRAKTNLEIILSKSKENENKIVQ